MSCLRSHFAIPLAFVLAIGLGGITLAADSPATPGLEYRVAFVSAGSGGVYTYTPDEWGLLHVHLSNPREEPVEVLCTSYFDSEPTLQYGRRVWLPARSRLQTWHPIRLPEISDPKQTQIEFHTLVSETGSSQEVFVRDDIGKLQVGNTLQVIRRSPVSAIVIPSGGEPDPSSVKPFDLLMTSRLELQLPRSISTLGDRELPATVEGLKSLDQLVLADDRMLHDAASLSAIRRWLYGGGRLWVMLDRVDPDLLAALLGDESGIHVVDTVTLTHVKITGRPSGPEINEHQAEYERPLKLVRALANDDNAVPLLVNGWPAAIWKSCGKGRLLVTTLESTAWVRPRTPAEATPSQDSSKYSNYVSIPALQELMSSYLAPMREASADEVLLEPVVGEYVGYEIPSRGLVSGLLGAFVGVLGILGLWLSRVGRQEFLAVITPVIAVLAAMALMFIGQQHREAVPPSTAVLQLVHPIPGTDEVEITGQAGLYAQDAGTAVLAGSEEGWLMPHLDGTTGTTRRMIWSDLNQWQWDNLPQVPGLRTAEFRAMLETPRRIAARGKFGPAGVTGLLTLPAAMKAEDAVLVTHSGRIGVDLGPDGGFEARPQNVLETDQQLSAALLSDVQSRRSRVLADVVGRLQPGPDFVPTMYFWTSPWATGFRFPENSRELGSALVMVPLQLERPPTGTLVSLPAPWLFYRETSGPDGFRPTGFYDFRHRAWSPRSTPSTAWLRFQFPRVLLPVRPSSGQMTVRVTGPVGKLELAMLRDGKEAPLKTWIDPVGTVTLKLSESDLPVLDADGGFVLRVSGGDPDRPELTNPDSNGAGLSYWQIESLTLDLEARILDREPGPSSP